MSYRPLTQVKSSMIMAPANDLEWSRSSVVSQPELRVAVYSQKEWPRIQPVWRQLASVSPECSFFMTEPWVDTWLHVFGARLDVSIVLFESADGPMAACLLVKTRQRHAFIPLLKISLNATGEDNADTTYIEFNQLLCRSGWERAVAAALAEFLIQQQWDEFVLDGFSPGLHYDALKRAFLPFDLEEVRHPSYYVDLAALRSSGKPYQTVLSTHRRKLLRQNLRSYSELGPIRLVAAGDLEAALAMFDEMAELNLRRWASASRPGVFGSPYFKAFHQRLIERCFAESSIQLLRLQAGSRTIGILYNFVHAGKVYFYQCGFDYGSDQRLSPGMITLSHAIQYCLELGLDDWDFLSGDANYKRMLSNGSRSLVWAAFRRRNVRVEMLKLARTARRFLENVRPGRLKAPINSHD